MASARYYAEEKSEGDEVLNKLRMTVSDLSKRVSGATKSLKNVDVLFSDEVRILKTKLQNACVKLIQTDPLQFGRTTEELLWKRVYYDAVYSTKKFAKVSPLSTYQSISLQNFIDSGIGFYSNLLMSYSLQSSIKVLDFGTPTYLLLGSSAKISDERSDSKSIEWAENMSYRCLICMGDLARYAVELCGKDAICAKRYYSLAITLKPNAGLPYNQLGTLAGYTSTTSIDSVYYFIRSLSTADPFDTSNDNLRLHFGKNRKKLEKISVECSKLNDTKLKKTLCYAEIFVAKFVYMCEIGWLHKEINCDPSVIVELQADVLQSFDHCITGVFGAFRNLSSKSPENGTKVETIIGGHLIFKLSLTAICCSIRLILNESPNALTFVLFLLSFYRHFVGCISSRITESRYADLVKAVARISVSAESLQSSKNRSKMSRLRRRRRGQRSSFNDSDSAGEDVNGFTSSDDELNPEEVSESEEDRDLSDVESSGDEAKQEDVIGSNGLGNGDGTSAEGEETRLGFGLLGEEESVCLQISKLFCDWLACNKEFLEISIKEDTVLWADYVPFLNFLLVLVEAAIADDDIRDDVLVMARKHLSGETVVIDTPLPEDFTLLGLAGFEPSRANLKFNNCRSTNLSSKEQNLLRSLNVLEFSRKVCEHPDSRIFYEAKLKRFGICREQPNADEADETILKNGQDVRKTKLVQNLTQLWLKAEVNELESALETTNLPPYVIVDSFVLTQKLTLLKQLVAAKRSIVIIPLVAIEVVDRIKKESLLAREAIRWMETEFKRGNRFVRAQKEHESISLSPMKYPSVKDKDGINAFKIVECCKYFSEQVNENGLVILLVLQKKAKTKKVGKPIAEVRAATLASVAGIATETVSDFVSKWRSSSKHRS